MLALRPQKQIVFSSTSLSDQASKYWLPSKELTAKVRPQPIAKHRNIQRIDNFGQLMNLFTRQKLAFIHQHAVNRL